MRPTPSRQDFPDDFSYDQAMTEYYTRWDEGSGTPPPAPPLGFGPSVPPLPSRPEVPVNRRPVLSKGLLLSVPLAVLLGSGLRVGSHAAPLWGRVLFGVVVAGLGSPRARGWLAGAGRLVAMLVGLAVVAVLVELVLVLTHTRVPWLGH
ncbi:hypothetical protein ACFW1A_24125 [Kitasatospora sp. NPDC058965]|uniref:hypothetical protein n=1 Tax=Kitasatospora sp. NPDC058965 TaxID=3346682 RepID=UPI0036742EF2